MFLMLHSAVVVLQWQWTSKSNHNYSSITAHWIDDNWQLNNVPLGIWLQETKSDSKSILENFLKELFSSEEMKQIRLFAVTSDTTSNMNSFGQMLSKMGVAHIYCTDVSDKF